MTKTDTLITSIDNIIAGNTYKFRGIVKKVDREGDQETRKPISLILQFEDTGVCVKMSAWDYSSLNVFKTAEKERCICIFSFTAKEWKDTITLNIKSIEKTSDITTLAKDVEFIDSDDAKQLKNWIPQLIGQVGNENYVSLLNYLIMNNQDFFIWKAAKSMHHAFAGGLAYHSYNVANNALTIATRYHGINEFIVNYDLLITGALLHDIGKLQEYDIDGEISENGILLSHMIFGIEIIDDACDKLGINKYSQDIIYLKHIISSHHRKLEFGSPNEPVLPEAYFISQADANDAEIEAMTEALKTVSSGKTSSPIKCLDNGRVMKEY